MEFWYLILFDLAFLALLGLLFYRFQRSRIIRSDKLELISRLNAFIESLPKEYSENLFLSLQTQSWPELKRDLKQLPEHLKNSEEEFEALLKDLEFFIQN